MRFLTLLASVIFWSSAACADPSNWRSVDVTKFDVASVKLYMNYDQVLAAISKNFQLSPDEIKRAKDSTIHSYNRITKSRQPSSMNFRKDGSTMEVTFTARVPLSQSEPVVVSRIHYGVPNTKENAASMKEAAISKYGQPSDDRLQSLIVWCAHYNQITRCEPLKPKLALASGSLVLEDPTVQEAAASYEQELLRTKPKI